MQKNRNSSALQALDTGIIFDLVEAHLSQRDKKALALVSSSLNVALQSSRTKCLARVDCNHHLQDLSLTLTRHPNIQQLSVRLVFFITTPNFANFGRAPSTSVQTLHLAFIGLHPTPPALRALGSSFQLVTSLTLQGSQSRPLNIDGSLAGLASMRNLRKLSLEGLASDAGLDAITQLRSLSIVYPDHLIICPDYLVCGNCGSIHAEDVLDYFSQVDFTRKVSIGSHLQTLPLLSTLTLDFCSITVERCAINGLLNSFLWQGNGFCFPALKSLTLLNCGCLEFVINNMMDPINSPENYPYSGFDLQSHARVQEFFAAVPELVLVRLQAHWPEDLEDEFPADLRWPELTKGSEVLTLTHEFIEDGDGVSFCEVRRVPATRSVAVEL